MSDYVKETAKSILNNQSLRRIIKIIALLAFIPVISTGFIFVLISTVVTIGDYNSIKNYTKITAKLESKTECDEDNLCKGIYLYTVNGTDYTTIPNYKTNVLADKINVYYNPSEPSKNHVLTNMSFFMIVGLILVGGAILFYIGTRKFISFICDTASIVIDDMPTVNKNQS